MKQWYVHRKKQKMGPFTADEIIEMRQRNALSEDDLLWKEGLKQWKPLVLVEDFSAHRMLELVHQKKQTPLINKRRHQRVRCHAGVLIHNNNQLWRGVVCSLSIGGALIEVDTPTLVAGGSLHIHFCSLSPDLTPFSCEARIIARRFSYERVKFNSSFQYSIEFKTMDEGALSFIKAHIEEQRTKQDLAT